MTRNRRNDWINWEISNILIPEYGPDALNWDYEDYTWVQILNFRLPPGWSKSCVPLLIEIPPTYPEALPRDVGFYTEKGLRDRNGFTTDHYFEENRSLNKYTDKNWAWL